MAHTAVNITSFRTHKDILFSHDKVAFYISMAVAGIAVVMHFTSRLYNVQAAMAALVMALITSIMFIITYVRARDIPYGPEDAHLALLWSCIAINLIASVSGLFPGTTIFMAAFATSLILGWFISKSVI